MKNLKLITFIAFFLGFKSLVFSQEGNKYLHNFTPFDYNASDQNWSSVQDKNGFIYVANLNGVLVYNGKHWKTVRLPEEVNVFSLDIDNKNTVYVGGESEFGYINKKKNGEFEYVSISKNLKDKDKEFTKTWATICINDNVFFCCNEKIFRLNNNVLSIFLPENDRFHTFFKINNNLFVREFGVGFKVFENNDLRFVLGSEIFSDLKTYSIIHRSGTTYNLFSRNGGVFQMLLNETHPSQSSFKKVNTPLQSWLLDNELYCGQKINNNLYVLGSLKNGLAFIDSSFNITTSINTKNGLQDNAVKHIYTDANLNLWLSLNNGISMVEYNTPITKWGKSNGINGTVENSIIYKNNLYVSTDKGLLKLDDKTQQFLETEITSPCYLLSIANNQLIICSDDGTYSFDGNSFELINSESSYSCYFDSNKKLLYIGTESSLLLFNEKNIISSRFDDIGTVRSIVCDNQGDCLIGTSNNGIYFLQNFKKIFNITKQEGLPSMSETNVLAFNNNFIVTTDLGFYEFDKKKLKVFKSKKLNTQQNMNLTKAFPINNQIWFQYAKSDKLKERIQEIMVLENKMLEWKEVQTSLNRIQNSSIKHCFLDSSKVYISSNQGLYSYEFNKFQHIDKFNVSISDITINKDSTYSLENYCLNDSVKIIEIDYKNNNIKLTVAATSYFDKNKIEFTYYLEGKETEFNSWTTSEVIEYNNLFEGEYTFHVKARDIIGNETNELIIQFKIFPPWYRTMFAYIAYGIFSILFIIAIIKIYTFQLKERNKILEKTVAQRTETIFDQKRELEHKNIEILDSINYAQRIQKSLLASEQMLQKNLSNYFVFFNPKDIVSGDFYWGYELDNEKFALVTADSTGHGVPGAIMSMLNISCLNEAVDGQKLKKTSDVLNYTRTKIIKNLSNDGSEQGGKDGMDCSLIIIHKETKVLEYSAANNPVWIVRNNQELIELKPDKMPVGKHDKDSEPFTQNNFKLMSNDIIYTLTDGMPDQFGGPKGKKFMYKQLKEFLVNISTLTMQEQKQILEDAFKKWKGDLEQVDDVLIIGIKIP